MSAHIWELVGEMVGKAGGFRRELNGCDSPGIWVKCGLFKQKDKLLPLGKAKEWGNGFVLDEMVDYIDHRHAVVLLWVLFKDIDSNKGRSDILELFFDKVKIMPSCVEHQSRSNLPSDIIFLLDKMFNAASDMIQVKSLAKAAQDSKNDESCNSAYSIKLLQLAHFDAKARSINH